MHVGDALFELAVQGGARRVFVAGTSKNAGKTVAMRALAQAAWARGLTLGLTSAGRDGEAVDADGSHTKPRLFLVPGTIAAIARGLLPPHPACELLEQTAWATAAGPVILARVRHAGYFELAGPSSAKSTGDALRHFEDLGADLSVVDGALDRIAALAAGADSVIVSAGAASAAAVEGVAELAGALVRRLQLPAVDRTRPSLTLDGALTPQLAAQLVRASERRQVVVRDATRVLASGKTLDGILSHLDVRCERSIRVAAVTVASIGPDRYFDPLELLQAVGAVVSVPVFDVYAGMRAAA